MVHSDVKKKKVIIKMTPSLWSLLLPEYDQICVFPCLQVLTDMVLQQ